MIAVYPCGSSDAAGPIQATPAPVSLALNRVWLSSYQSDTSVVGGSPVTGTVYLTRAVPTGGSVAVTLSSGSGMATFPDGPAVTVPAGQFSATFTINTAPVSAVTMVTISAAYNGTTRTAQLWVYPPPPPAPSLTAVAASASQINLSWTSSGTGYVLARSADGSTGWSQIATTAALFFQDTGCAPATAYFYRVSATGAGGTSGYSNVAQATTAPVAPTGLTAVPHDRRVDLRWAAVAGATGYRVKRATVSGGPYATVAAVTSPGDSDTGLTNGTTYYYVVTAANIGGESATSNEASATPIMPDFRLGVEPSPLKVMVGDSTRATVTITPLGDFTGPVTLGVSNLPPGVTAAFDPATGGEKALTLTLSPGVPVGIYPLMVTATAGDLVHSAPLELHVVDFGLAADPAAFTTPAGGIGDGMVNIVPLGDFDLPVALSASGLPAGVRAVFTSRLQGMAQTLSLLVGRHVPQGTYSFDVVGHAGANASHRVSLTVTVTSGPGNGSLKWTSLVHPLPGLPFRIGTPDIDGENAPQLLDGSTDDTATAYESSSTGQIVSNAGIRALYDFGPVNAPLVASARFTAQFAHVAPTYVLQYSNDGVSWTEPRAADANPPQGGVGSFETEALTLESPTNARFWRLVVQDYPLTPNAGLAGSPSDVCLSDFRLFDAAGNEIYPPQTGLIRNLPGFLGNVLAPNDDESTDLVSLGMPYALNFFGTAYDAAFVNNNGNITFSTPLSQYTPNGFVYGRFDDFGVPSGISQGMIAPFFADVDTRSGNVMTYGNDTLGGHPAFGVNWNNVGYYANHTDKLNTFQLVLIDRSDTGPGNFDFEYNYDCLTWETGDASGGMGGFGGFPADAGYTAGTGGANTYLQLPGSSVSKRLLDTNMDTGLTNNGARSVWQGRYYYSVRGGVVIHGGPGGSPGETGLDPFDDVPSGSGPGGTASGAPGSGGGGAPPFVGGFGLSVAPSSLSVRQRENGAATVTVTALYGFRRSVTLYLLDDPDHPILGTRDNQGRVSGDFSPRRVSLTSDGDATSALTLAVGGEAAPGQYALTVIGVAGDQRQAMRLTLTIQAGSPEIAVSADGRDVPSSSSVEFGGVRLSVPVTKTFTVTNTQGGALTLGDATATGPFTVIGQPDGPLYAGQSAALTVRFDPAALGAQSGTLSIPSNDQDNGDGVENPFILALSGTGLPPPPAAPLLTAAAGDHQAGLHWTAISGASSYNIYRSVGYGWDFWFGGGDMTLYQSGVSATDFTDTGLDNGTTYFYQVVAVDDGGEGARSNEASATPGTAPLPAPILSASTGDRQVTLTWAPVDGAYTYNLYRATTPGGEGAVPIATSVGDGGWYYGFPITYTDTGLTNGTTYYYQVTAVDPDGEGDRSNEANATPQAPAVTLSDLTLLPGSVASGGSITGTVTLTGPAPAGGVTVALSCDNPSVVTVPASVSVPEGATSAAFTLSTMTVFQAVTVGVTASLGGVTRSAPLTVTMGASSGDPQVPQGGSASFPATGFDYSFGSLWAITLAGAVVATSDAPNGWSVNFDGQFTVGAPSDALVTTGYWVTYDFGGGPAAAFDVVPGGGTGPRLAVSIDGQPLPQEGMLSFGETPVGTPVRRTITLQNTGGTTLTLGQITLPAGFSLAQPPASTSLAPQQATTLVLQLDAAATGTQSGTVSLASDDASQGLFAFAVDGNVTAAPVPSSITVSPNPATMPIGATQQFTATALAQNGAPLSPQPAFTWSVSGGGVVDGNGLFTAGNTVGGSFTVTAQSGTVSGVASLTVTDVPPAALTAVSTGSGKVTLYWSGVVNATGYNVYRGTAAGGEDYAHPINGTTPVTTLDTGPGVTNMFMYSDTGLTNGTEYFYTVEAVNGAAQSEPSNEDSDVPNPNAVPWDTGDPVQIIAKVNATAANDLEPDIDEDTGDQYPADVGFLNVAAPDGVVYLGNFPDGSAPQAYASSGHFDAASGMIANNDGTFTAAPGDSATTSTDNASMTSMSSPMASASTVADGFPYLPTSPPSGIYREVQAQPGYWGTSATIGLPDASSGSGQVNLVGKDNAYIYLGGSVSYPTGVFPAGTRAPDFQLDAGFQLSENPCPNQQWVPYVGGHQPNDPIINGGVVTTSGSGWYTYMSGEIRTQFLTPNFSSVPDKTIKLHFSVPAGGIGTGKIIVAQTQGIDPDHCPHRISSFSAYSVTLVYAHVRGWRTSQYNAVHPEAGNNRFILKRINSIAQTLNPANYNAATDTPHSLHPGAPLANGPSEYNSKGFLMDGSYVQAFGGGSFSGAYWGYSDTNGVELYSPGRGWSSWTDDSSMTLHAGAYPIGLPYVTWVEQNPFYWETNVALRTTH